MIYGIGVDVVEFSKVKKVVKCSGDKLAKRILRKPELKIYYAEKYPIRFLSKRFAAKEAATKAFGLGISQGITFNQFEVFNDDAGKPILRLFSNAALLAKKLSLVRSHLTISDTYSYAYAVVIFEY